MSKADQDPDLLAGATSEVGAHEILVRQARPLLPAYGTSWFLVKGVSLRPRLTGKSHKHAQPIVSEHQ